jgi:hypothetical protein
VLENDEIQQFKKAYGVKKYIPEITIFQNYRDMASRIDCLAFHQIDEDVEAFEFSSRYLSDWTLS